MISTISDNVGCSYLYVVSIKDLNRVIENVPEDDVWMYEAGP